MIELIKKGRDRVKIVFLDAKTIGKDIDLDCIRNLGETEIYDKTPNEETGLRIAKAQVVITNKCKLNREVLAGAENLKLICITATGYDNVDMEYARSRNIAVCNVKDYSTDSVAQLTVGMALSLCCRLNTYDAYCKSGKYTESGIHNCLEPVFYELAGKTWGIYGFGNIGKKVAKVAQSLGCNILVCKRTPVKDVKCVSLDELFEKSDIVSVHTPLNEQTAGSINSQVLEKAKKGLVLVNVARGAVTVEEDVAQAVEKGILGGFGCDVYSSEPMSHDSPFQRLCEMENVIFTPHMAWGAYEARVRLIDEVCRNIEAFSTGEIRNRVDLSSN